MNLLFSKYTKEVFNVQKSVSSKHDTHGRPVHPYPPAGDALSSSVSLSHGKRQKCRAFNRNTDDNNKSLVRMDDAFLE